MVLADCDILEYLHDFSESEIPALKNLTKIIENEKGLQEQLQPASFDVRLSDSFSIIDYNDYIGNQISLDTKNKDNIKYKNYTRDEWILQPREFVLGSTIEKINLPKNVAAIVEGKSSLARMGLSVQNAAWINPGFSGQITLELFNNNKIPIILRSGEFIAQIIFLRLESNPMRRYNGQYNDQIGATPPK